MGAKALGTLFFFLRGTPFIYQGQELGMKNFKRGTIADFNDVSSIDNYQRSMLEGYTSQEALEFVNQRSRDNSRTPFQWNSSETAGFSESTVPWLKLVGDHTTVNARVQLEKEDSVLCYYKKMIQLRNKSKYRETLIYGEFVPMNTTDHIIAYERIGRETIQVIINLSNQASLIEGLSGEILLNNYSEITYEKNGLTLQPYQALVLRKEENNG
ncbi:alpha-amylase family glycosyl hydrolase [Niallia sp. FSL W8-1348]|uniref:alpha-amylase family glycosyl hydrolase n=1 Tax=Niallia sp. FSL W8-1348 TaxID=2954656 RepID=UPI0030F64D7B